MLLSQTCITTNFTTFIKNEEKLEQAEELLPPVHNGIVYRAGHYIPRFTLEANPQFASFYGLIGKANEQKIASTFLKPTTWKEYCEEVITSAECLSGNDTYAWRLPKNEFEEQKYFDFEGGFIGYFRETSSSNCDNSNDCHGYFVDTDCHVNNAFSESQMYWNNISLVSDGSQGFNGGYSWDEMKQIGLAAYYTNSNAMIVLSNPSGYRAAFSGSDGEWIRVQFPESSENCREHQLKQTLTCTTNKTDRVGSNSLGSCDYPVENDYKILSSSVKLVHDSVPEAMKSPALEFLTSFMIEASTMQNVLDQIALLNYEIYFPTVGYNEREAICKWVYDNLESITASIPNGFPREIQKKGFNETLFRVAMVFSILSLCFVILMIIILCRHQKRRVIRFVQTSFLVWIVGGKNC